MLHSHNSYVQILKAAPDKMPSDEYKLVICAELGPTGEHPRRFNKSATNEVAIVIGGNKFHRQDSVLERRNRQLQQVAETHRSYDSLQYPLIFWKEEDGYHFFISQINPRTGIPINGKKV